MTSPNTDKLVVYQLFPRYFGNYNTTNKYYGSRDENGVGKFNDITEKALNELKQFGISHLWFTAIIEHATMTDDTAHGIAKDNPAVVKGKAGSPYAIKDYYDVDPDLAVDVARRMNEFEALVARTHQAGLKVVIDFVPNHVARQYQSDVKPKGTKDFGQNDDKNKPFDAQNNFYYLPNQSFVVPDDVVTPPGIKGFDYVEKPAKATGNDVFSAKPNINDWFETVKLNYGVDILNNRKKHFDVIPDTWVKMRDILLYWAAKGVDGFRCDMAEMVPVEFWQWAIEAVKKQYSDTIFIAEIYNPTEYHNYLFKGKFDYLYDKVGLYDALRRLIEGGGNTAEITQVWQKESGEFSNRMLRFLENHDEHRITAPQFGRNAFHAIPALVLSATLHTGPLMLYCGQELGVTPDRSEGFQGDDGRSTYFDYWGVPELQAWTNNGQFDGGKLSLEQKKLRSLYADLLQLINHSEAIRVGAFYDLQYANDFKTNKIYSYLRYSAGQKLLIVCNFDLYNSHHAHINIPAHAWESMGLDAHKNHVFRDKLYHQTFEVSGTASVDLQLLPNSVFVLEIS